MESASLSGLELEMTSAAEVLLEMGSAIESEGQRETESGPELAMESEILLQSPLEMQTVKAMGAAFPMAR
jgi:hypothetical protein